MARNTYKILALALALFHLGNAALSITGVRLSRLDPQESAPIAGRTWRLLGRLQISLRGRRPADGSVTVPKALRPYMGGRERLEPVGK